MTIMRKMGKSLVLGMVLVIALTGTAIGNAMWAKDMAHVGTVQIGNLQLGFSAASSNDTANCTTVWDYQQVNVTILNAYPGYKCTTNVTVHNDGTLPGRITAINITNPPEITVTPIVNLVNMVLDPGQSADGSFLVHVEGSAQEYSFSMTISYVLWNQP